MKINQNKAVKKMKVLENSSANTQEIGEKSPYMNKEIYHNYEKGMKERNQKRMKQGLEILHIRSFEEWSGE